MACQAVFGIYAAMVLAALMLLLFMRAPQSNVRVNLEDKLRKNLMEACRDPSFGMLFLGFFSCGYLLVFMTSHFPAFVAEA